MAKYYYTSIDLKGNQLLNGAIHPSETAPENGVVGQVYYNTSQKLMYQHNGTGWVVVGGSVENLTSNDTKVVTGVSTSVGKATLATTDLKNMKIGVGLQNLTNVTASTTLKDEFQALDTAIQGVKNDYVKKGSTFATGGKIIVSDQDVVGTAITTNYTIADEITGESVDNTTLPTSTAVRTYVASLAGGLIYKGTLDSENGSDTSGSTCRKTLPENPVNGDVWVVAKDGTYGGQESYKGDIFVASVSDGVTTWSKIPLDFTVINKDATLVPGAANSTSIAVIDGVNITAKVDGITSTDTGSGNGVSAVTASGKTVTVTKSNFLTNVTPSTAGNGVVTSVVNDNYVVRVTYKDLTTTIDGLQYVKTISQSSNGKINITPGNFISTISSSNPSEINAPTVKAVKDYVDNKINVLDATVDADVQTASGTTVATTVSTPDADFKVLNSIVETDGKFASGTGYQLKKLAATALANDLSVTSRTYGGASATTNAQTALINLDEAIANSQITIDRHKGSITTGNGLTKVTTDGGSFGINLDSTNSNGLYLNGTTDGSKTLAMHIASDSATTGGSYGTVKVTSGNGLTLSDGVIAYAHNTTAIAIATISSGVVTLKGTLTPDSSDSITTSNPITFSKIATTGAAVDVSITDSGSIIDATNVEGALQELAEKVDHANTNNAKIFNVTSPAIVSGTPWNINFTVPTEYTFDAKTGATVSVRQSSNGEEVECDKILNGNQISLTFNAGFSAGSFIAVVVADGNVISIANN